MKRSRHRTQPLNAGPPGASEAPLLPPKSEHPAAAPFGVQPITTPPIAAPFQPLELTPTIEMLEWRIQLRDPSDPVTLRLGDVAALVGSSLYPNERFWSLWASGDNRELLRQQGLCLDFAVYEQHKIWYLSVFNGMAPPHCHSHPVDARARRRPR